MARSRSRAIPPVATDSGSPVQPSSTAQPSPDAVPVTPTVPTVPTSVAIPIPPPAPPAPVAPVQVLPPEASLPRGLEQVEREDLVIPRIAILQATAAQKLEVAPGVFIDRVTNEMRKTLEGVVPLRFTKGRVWFEEMDEGGGVLCASDDRIAPAARIENPVQPKCAGCPKSLWMRDGQKNTPPDCQETWTMLMLLDGMPYFITFKSGAMRATKKLLTQLTLTAKKDRRDAFGYCFDVALELLHYTAGSAYQPVFKNLRRVKDHDYALYGSMYEAFAHIEPTFDDPGDGAPPSAEAPRAGGQTDFPFGANMTDAPGAAE